MGITEYHLSSAWSDHGTNFIGAEREIAKLLQNEETAREIAGFCTSRKVNWRFLPEWTPHFGGLWEAAVKNLKSHLRKVLGEDKLSFEEFSIVLIQVEASLLSRPLIPLPETSDTVEVLTPGRFLIGRPITALPDETTYQVVEPLKWWL